MRVDRTLLLVLGFIALVAIVWMVGVDDHPRSTRPEDSRSPVAPEPPEARSIPPEARAKGTHQPKGAGWALEETR